MFVHVFVSSTLVWLRGVLLKDNMSIYKYTKGKVQGRYVLQTLCRCTGILILYPENIIRKNDFDVKKVSGYCFTTTSYCDYFKENVVNIGLLCSEKGFGGQLLCGLQEYKSTYIITLCAVPSAKDFYMDAGRFSSVMNYKHLSEHTKYGCVSMYFVPTEHVLNERFTFDFSLTELRYFHNKLCTTDKVTDVDCFLAYRRKCVELMTNLNKTLKTDLDLHYGKKQTPNILKQLFKDNMKARKA